MTRISLGSICAAWALVLVVGIAAGCSAPRLVDPTVAALPASDVDLLPPSGSDTDDLPPPVVRPVGGSDYRAPQPPSTYPSPTAGPQPTFSAPQPVPATPQPRAPVEPVPPSWSTPAPVSQPMYQPAPGRTTPLPPPPPSTPGTVTRYYAPTTTVGTTSLADRCWSGCGLPCEQGISKWHVRGVVGWPFFVGTDEPDGCSYWGVDLGRTHCGCWGYDLYYRMAGAKYKRDVVDDTGAVVGTSKDGGFSHHFGLKLTYEKSFGNSRFYGWGGLGGGYYFTDQYWEDSEGWEIYGELGVGYVINRTWRVRAGVNVHGYDDEATRRSVLDAGSARWMWLIAPVVEVEANF